MIANDVPLRDDVLDIAWVLGIVQRPHLSSVRVEQDGRATGPLSRGGQRLASQRSGVHRRVGGASAQPSASRARLQWQARGACH